jgi:hypothetical protein
MPSDLALESQTQRYLYVPVGTLDIHQFKKTLTEP